MSNDETILFLFLANYLYTYSLYARTMFFSTDLLLPSISTLPPVHQTQTRRLWTRPSLKIRRLTRSNFSEFQDCCNSDVPACIDTNVADAVAWSWWACSAKESSELWWKRKHTTSAVRGSGQQLPSRCSEVRRLTSTQRCVLFPAKIYMQILVLFFCNFKLFYIDKINKSESLILLSAVTSYCENLHFTIRIVATYNKLKQ